MAKSRFQLEADPLLGILFIVEICLSVGGVKGTTAATAAMDAIAGELMG
jgi:hypothetical protein